jgi:phage virion morphogenesis protein
VGTAQTITLSGFAKSLDDAAKLFPSLSYEKPLQLCAIALAAETKKNFEQSREPDGARWLPLAQPRNRKRDKVKRNRKSTGDKPLVDSGLLMASVSAAQAGSQGSIRDVSATRLVYGSNIEYGIFHQYGTMQRGFVHIPARPWLGINRQATETMSKILEEYVVGRFLMAMGG